MPVFVLILDRILEAPLTFVHLLGAWGLDAGAIWLWDCNARLVMPKCGRNSLSTSWAEVIVQSEGIVIVSVASCFFCMYGIGGKT